MTVSPEDFIEICDLCYGYAAGVDGRDWARYRAIFTDRVVFDFSSYDGQPAAEMAADDWVAGVKPMFTALAATQHSMTNPPVTVESDTASRRTDCKPRLASWRRWITRTS